MPLAVRAAVHHGGGAPPVIEPLLLDDPAPDELIIEVKAAGICHTDLTVADWTSEPRVLGHEGAGIVAETGSAVSEFSVGDRVLATFGFCGMCQVCTSGRPAYCVDGTAINFEGRRSVDRPTHTRRDGSLVGGAFFQQSCFATHALVTQRNLVKIPDDMSFINAAPFGCGVQTGAGAVFNQLGIEEAQPLVIVGCGAVGLSAIMAGRVIGCDPIIAIDLIPERCELALSLGASHSLDGHDLAASIMEITHGGAAAVLDTAGSQSTFEQSLHALRPGGTLGTLTLPGAFDQPVQHPGGLPFLTTRIVGIVEGDSVPNEFLPKLFELQQSGHLPIERLIEPYAFEAIADAFGAMARKQIIKPVLTFGA